MRSFLPFYGFVWILALVLTFLAPRFKAELPQPWWYITLFGSFIFMVWALLSKEKWLK